jgi:hypothetical protein
MARRKKRDERPAAVTEATPIEVGEQEDQYAIAPAGDGAPARDLTVVRPVDLIARHERSFDENELIRLGALDPIVRARNAAGQIAAVWPREALMAPIWHDDRQAVKVEHASFDWSQQVDGAWRYRRVETKNNRGAEGKGHLAPSPNPLGLLRHLDLDVAMALTFEYMVRQRTMIALDEETLLPWLGYRYLERPPYEELRASVERIKHTDIVFSDIDPSVVAEDRKKSQLNYSFRILQQASTSDGTRGQPLSATLSNDWKKMIEGSSPMMRQVFDLRGYFTLVRRIRHAIVDSADDTAPKISRSIYLFLAAWRKDDVTRIPISWLQIRFAERQRVKNRNLFRFANPWNRNSRIWRSLERMLAFGILRSVEPDLYREDLGEDSHPYLMIVWAKPDQLDLIPPPKGISQQYWLKIDRLSEKEPMPKLEYDLPPKPALLESEPSLDEGKELPADGKGPDLLEWLRSKIEYAPEAQAKALDNGWTKTQLALVYLWHYWRWSAPKDDPSRIQSPGGYVRRVVESGGRSGWTRAGLRERAGAHWDELRGWIAQQGRRGEGRTIAALIDPATQVKGAAPGAPPGSEQEASGDEALTAADRPAAMSPGGQKVHELRQAIRAHLGKERAAQIAARALAMEQAMPKATAYERLLAALRKVAGDDAELVLELLGE